MKHVTTTMYSGALLMTFSGFCAEPQPRFAVPEGVVLTGAVHGSLGENDYVPTADGTWLSGVLPPNRDRQADGQEIGVACIAAVGLDPENTGEHNNGFILTLALADATGQLWQTAERVNSYFLWEQVFSWATCYDRQTPLERPDHVLSRSERILFEKLHGFFDSRDRRLLRLVRRKHDAKDGFVQFVFPIKEKYLGYSMSLVERSTVYRHRQPETSPSHIVSLSLSIEFFTDSESVVALDSSNRPIPMKPVALLDVSPIRCESVFLRPTWRKILGPARKADANAWRTALTKAGTQEAQIEKLFAPNKHLVVKNRVQTGVPTTKSTLSSEASPSDER
jgi:hypothetical protein